MDLVRLIYVSLMTEECDTNALQRILEVSRANNTARKVSGILCYDPAYFLQCLEGPRESVNALFADIIRDARHKRVTLLEYVNIEERGFGAWSMAFVHTGSIDRQVIVKYTDGSRFDPFMLSSARAHAFLAEVAHCGSGQLARQR
jgi:hypothetical protein